MYLRDACVTIFHYALAPVTVPRLHAWLYRLLAAMVIVTAVMRHLRWV